jgi:hypothetical protein
MTSYSPPGTDSSLEFLIFRAADRGPLCVWFSSAHMPAFAN